MLTSWLGPPAYRLWNLPDPPGAMRGGLGPGANLQPAEVGRTAEWLAAVASLPALPELVPPEGQTVGQRRWVSWNNYEEMQQSRSHCCRGDFGAESAIRPFVALTGPWLPERFILGKVAAYLELPATRTALERIKGCSSRPFEVGDGVGDERAAYDRMRRVLELLIVQARYDLAGKHDGAAARGDIEAALQLVQSLEDSGGANDLCGCWSLRQEVFEELIHWCVEDVLSPEQARHLLRLLNQRHLDEAALQRIIAEKDIRSVVARLDAWYAPGKNERLVLGRRARRSGNWLVMSLNLLAPLLYERGEAERWIVNSYALGTTEQAGAVKLLRGRGNQLLIEQDPRMGCAGECYWSDTGRWLKGPRTHEAGARTMLALTVFRAEHGQYPDRLEELVPAYLDAVPCDAYSSQPLRYRREEGGRYRLASANDPFFGDELVLTEERCAPCREWVLVAIAPSSQAASAPAGGK